MLERMEEEPLHKLNLENRCVFIQKSLQMEFVFGHLSYYNNAIKCYHWQPVYFS